MKKQLDRAQLIKFLYEGYNSNIINMTKNVKVALIYPPYGDNENFALFSLAYLIGGLRDKSKNLFF